MHLLVCCMNYMNMHGMYNIKKSSTQPLLLDHSLYPGSTTSTYCIGHQHPQSFSGVGNSAFLRLRVISWRTFQARVLVQVDGHSKWGNLIGWAVQF
jgi:hypothetical protein